MSYIMTKSAVTTHILSGKFVETQVASKIARCNMPHSYKVKQCFCFARSIAQLKERPSYNLSCNISVEQAIKTFYFKTVSSL